MKSVIFDLDGTILDTEQLHRITFNRVLDELGVKLSQEKWDSFRGLGAIRIFKTIFEENNIDVDLVEINSRRDKYFDELIMKDGIPLVKGFKEFYNSLIEKGIKVIIGTSGRRINVSEELELSHLNLEYVCVDDVGKAKPEPDIFLLCAKRLGVDVKDCIVFEDSGAGIIAAHRAGMQVVGVSATTDKDELKEADLIVKDYTYFDEQRINEFLGLK
ncbi:MAG: HAD family phosphatase [Nanoarchaeota archaeon]|nr:HAD family phosphatase [Nanoarchaeota archaeon]